MVSQVNMYSSPLTTASMVALTISEEECNAPGDVISWEGATWKLSSKARIQMVEEFEGPCRRGSSLDVFQPSSSHKDCMEHCQKLGQGRSPPVRTLKEWDWLRNELNTSSQGTRRYSPLRGLTSSSCGGLRPMLFLPFGQKKSLLRCFGPFLAFFGVQ